MVKKRLRTKPITIIRGTKMVHLRPDVAAREEAARNKKKNKISNSSLIAPPENLHKYKIAIFMHLYYRDTWEEMQAYLNKFPIKFSLYVNLVKGKSNHIKHIEKIKSAYPEVTIIESDNVGKDVGGKLNLIKEWINKGDDFDYLIFCHDKKSPHMKHNGGTRWRNQLLRGILSKPATYHSINAFESDRVGMTGCRRWVMEGKKNHPNIYGEPLNKIYLKKFFSMFNMNPSKISFVGGTMFWVKASIFKSFFTKYNPDLILKQLESGDVREPSNTHAVERLFGCIVIDSNFRIERTV